MPTTIRVKRVLVDPNSAPKAAHKFMFTRVGVDIVLEVGHYDLSKLREAIEADKAGKTNDAELQEVDLFISDRFVLSPQGVSDLASVAKSLESDMANYVQAATDAEGVTTEKEKV